MDESQIFRISTRGKESQVGDVLLQWYHMLILSDEPDKSVYTEILQEFYLLFVGYSLSSLLVLTKKIMFSFIFRVA